MTSLVFQEIELTIVYDVSDYDEIKGDKEGYNKIITQEYAYWNF